MRTGYLQPPDIEGADSAWAEWIERWYATSTLTPKVRRVIRTILAKAGRWLAVEHPELTDPGQWTRATCAAWVAAVDRMSVGDLVQRRDALGDRAGEPVIPRRFDPNRALALGHTGDVIACLYFWDAQRGPGPVPPTAGAP